MVGRLRKLGRVLDDTLVGPAELAKSMAPPMEGKSQAKVSGRFAAKDKSVYEPVQIKVTLVHSPAVVKPAKKPTK